MCSSLRVGEVSKNSPHSTVPNSRISVVGLGYVGLPLAVELTKYYTVGFDINKMRVDELRSGIDRT